MNWSQSWEDTSQMYGYCNNLRVNSSGDATGWRQVVAASRGQRPVQIVGPEDTWGVTVYKPSGHVPMMPVLGFN